MGGSHNWEALCVGNTMVSNGRYGVVAAIRGSTVLNFVFFSQIGRSPSKRGVGTMFGPDITTKFCNDNDLGKIINYSSMKYLIIT